jgi:tRNA(Met) C34 N-acetyltransferase TmcA
LDLSRLRSYIDGTIEYYIIKDLVPKLCYIYFNNFVPQDTRLSYSQCYIFIALGILNKSVDDIARLLNITAEQILALLGKAIRKITNCVLKIKEKEITKDLNLENQNN